jgi:hypothetical protein
MLIRISAIAGAVVLGAILVCGAAFAQPVTPPPPSGASNGQTYTVTQTSSSGATPSGNGKWALTVNTLAGGDAAVANAFNQASKNSAQGQLNEVRPNATTDGIWTFNTVPKIYFGGASVSQLLNGLFVAVPSAHPLNFVSTVVIDSRNAAPITLGDLFIDEQAGLNRLSDQTKLLLPAVMGMGTTPMADEPGNAPVEKNFANWLPTPAGLEIHFEDYQFVHGTPVLTVPWQALDGLLNPNMLALRLP